MDLGLAGRVAAVAGGTSGLGLASAHALAAEGTTVAVCGRDPGRVRAAGQQTDGEDPAERLHATAVDVTDHARARIWVDDVARTHGGLHILVANAGGPPPGRATAFDVTAYRQALELSLLSQINLVQASLPHMQAAGWGRILFITSKSVRQPIADLALSNTARAGVLGYAKSLVEDLGAGAITVNVLAPGATRTARLESLAGPDVEAGIAGMASAIPLGRVGRPEEFAAALAFLASERASFITGVTLPVDGGEIRGL